MKQSMDDIFYSNFHLLEMDMGTIIPSFYNLVRRNAEDLNFEKISSWATVEAF